MSNPIIGLLFLLAIVIYLIILYIYFYKQIKELRNEKYEQELTINLLEKANTKQKIYIEKLESIIYNDVKEDKSGIQRNT